MKILYSVNVGDYDRPIPLNQDFVPKGWLPIYLTDQKTLEVPGWHTKYFKQNPSLPSVVMSRDPKLRPHKYFPQASETLYIDATRSVTQPIQNFVNDVLAPAEGLVEWCSKHHTRRNCVYQELEAPRVKKLVPTDVREFLWTFYKAEHFPEHHGLPENPVIYRKNTMKVQLAGEMWWAMMHLNKAYRDQILLPYVLWKLGISPLLIEDAILSQYVVKKHKHKKR
jgi:hypothetical protein